MSFSIDVVQDEILAFLRDEVFPGRPVHEQTVSDTTILETNDRGGVKTYIAVQFGDIRYAGNETFGGIRSADWNLPVKGKIVVSGQSAELGRKLRNNFYNKFYGVKFEWAGQIRPMSGIAGEFALRKSDAIEAIIFPFGVGITTQFLEIPEP